MWAAAALIFLFTASFFRPYGDLVRGFGDSAAYIQIADAIRHWDFSNVQVKHFWGLPYAMALLGKLTGVSSQSALIAISCASSFAALALAYRLWGGWIALFTSLLNFDWYQRSFLGGSEPLFLALLLASILALRKEKSKSAALLASLATITRPLGICLLLGIGLDLLRRRQWIKLAGAVAISAFIGILYVTPLRLYLHDPLATVHSYGMMQQNDYPALFGIPFRAIFVGTFRYPPPLSNLLLDFAWIFLVIGGNIAMFTRDFRQYARAHFAEMVFVALYSLSLYTYNLPFWARSNFARFAIPILPFVFLALQRWLPKDRRLLWLFAIVFPALAASSAVGIQNVISGLRNR